MVKDGQTYWLPNLFTYSDLLADNFYRKAARWEPADNEYALKPLVPHSPTTQLRASAANHRARESSGDGFLRPRRAQPPDLGHADFYDDRPRVRWYRRRHRDHLRSHRRLLRGTVDILIQRLIEIVLCFPTFFLILALIAYLPPSIYNIMIALGATGWPGIARLVRGEFLKLRQTEFALAARAAGLPDRRVIFRHLLPNALAPVLVSATFGIAGAILTESALSFLGFGFSLPTQAGANCSSRLTVS